MGDQPVVRVLWHSNDGGRTWTECEVKARSPLSGGVAHPPDGWWTDGYDTLVELLGEALSGVVEFDLAIIGGKDEDDLMAQIQPYIGPNTKMLNA